MKNNPFQFSVDNKRYHTLNYYNKNKYGRKIFKAVLDCGFTCPNIDGFKGFGGCIFCDGGSGYFTNGNLSLYKQMKNEIFRINSKYGKNMHIIAYFQSNTNTYANAEYLSKLYDDVLSFPDVCGISIGTRADCLSDAVLEVLIDLSKRTNLTIELGLQSVHNSTIEYINRCYSHEEFVSGYNKLKLNNLRTCLHIINGLPYETKDMMLDTAREISKLHPDALKIQMLHVIEGTRLAAIYKNTPFSLLTKDEYIDVVVHQLELLPSDIVIERITGDGDKSKLIAPIWSTDKISVLGGIDKYQALLDTWQGKYYNNK